MKALRLLAIIIIAIVFTIPVLLVALFCNEDQQGRFIDWLRDICARIDAHLGGRA